MTRENESGINQKLKEAMKTVLEGKFIAISIAISIFKKKNISTQ